MSFGSFLGKRASFVLLIKLFCYFGTWSVSGINPCLISTERLAIISASSPWKAETCPHPRHLTSKALLESLKMPLQRSFPHAWHRYSRKSLASITFMLRLHFSGVKNTKPRCRPFILFLFFSTPIFSPSMLFLRQLVKGKLALF